MGYVFVIFGSLIALNFGLGAKLSEGGRPAWESESHVEVESLPGTQQAD